MSLIGTKYDVCECNSLRGMTLSSFFITFNLHLWPSSSLKVTYIFIIWWTICCRVLVPRTKFVGKIEQLFWENLKGVTMTSSPIRFYEIWSNEIYKLGKLTENYGEKMSITSLWPWPLTQGNQFQKDSSQYGKQPISENRVQIVSSDRLEFC